MEPTPPTRAEPRLSPRGAAIAFGGIIVAGWVVQLAAHGVLPTVDDYFRVHLVRFAGIDPELRQWLFYWPPLPLIASWIALGFGSAPAWLGLASLGSMLAIAAAFALLAWDSARRDSDIDGGLWTLFLMLGVPVVFRLSASALAEPWAFFGLACAWIALRAKPGEGEPRRRALWFLLGGIAMSMSRYEYWIIVALGGIAAALRARRESPDARAWARLWGATAAGLCVFPLGWFVLNHFAMGSWNAPFLVDQYTSVKDVPLGLKVELFVGVTLEAAPLAIVLGAYGAFILLSGRRFAQLAVIGILAVPIAVIYSRPDMHPIWHHRFALALLFASSALGGIAARSLVAETPGLKPLLGGLAGIAILVALWRATIWFAGDPMHGFLHEVHRAGKLHAPPAGQVLMLNHFHSNDFLYLTAPLPRSRIILATDFKGDPLVFVDDLDLSAISAVYFDSDERLAEFGLAVGRSETMIEPWRIGTGISRVGGTP